MQKMGGCIQHISGRFFGGVKMVYNIGEYLDTSKQTASSLLKCQNQIQNPVLNPVSVSSSQQALQFIPYN